MERTIDEIYNIIVIKRENARNDRERKRNDLSNSEEWRVNESIRLYGEIEAYTDVLCLIESSQILKEDNEK